jgi:hypothetical protein
MAYGNNLVSFTSKTTPATPHAPAASVVCDFGWYLTSVNRTCGVMAPYTLASLNAQGQTVGFLYPPPLENDPRSDWGTVILDYITLVDNEITFDCSNSLSITTAVPGAGTYPLPVTVVPAGIQIIEYNWDFGNGSTAQGPVVSTTYTQATPDGACTLTVTDSLGRVTRTTKRLNFVAALPLIGNIGRNVAT